MRLNFRAVAVGLALAMSGCVTTSGSPITTLTPVAEALTRPVDELRAAADKGEAKSQYGLSILAADGLRGVPRDAERAARLRQQAIGVKGFTPITQYIPGINGAPGRVSILNMPKYDLLPGEVAAMDRCVAALRTGKLSSPQASACGPSDVYDWLRQRWAGGDAPAPAVWRVATLRCGDTVAISALWSLAAESFEAGQYATAARHADRIIAACGETEPSWHPRVMRALIAIADKEPSRALSLLAPVPKPAPAPVGSASSFVGLAAAAAAKDWPRFDKLRTDLVTATGAAIVGGPLKGVLVERFTGGSATVAAYRALIPDPQLTSHLDFLVTPSGEGAGSIAIHLTSSPSETGATDLSWFVDEYRCDGRSTLKYFGARKTEPSYAEVKAIVTERLAGRLQPVSGSRFNRGLEACQWPTWVAPGLPG